MNLKFILANILMAGILSSCGNTQLKHDAAGIFEADEVIVSSEVSGKLLQLNLKEGDVLKKDSLVAVIDALPINLQQKRLESQITSLGQKTQDVQPQVKLLKDEIAVLQTQLDNLYYERKRIENLIKADAATQKQLDDYNFQIETVKKQITVDQQQIAVQVNNVSTANRTILSDTDPLKKQIAELKDTEVRTKVLNPINGTVLTKYAMAGEVTTAGKALYKIADLSTIILRSYITGDQLPAVKLGQTVKVFIDKDNKSYQEYPGTITMIADKAEFTPKTIQTKEERANLVYAVKVTVKNDGYLKIGMYGEIQFK